MSKLAWYWHRLRAMSPGEVVLHARKKLRQFSDARRTWDASALKLECSGAFPKLPRPEDAPEVLREALKRDVEDILAGRWKAFGHLEIQVDDPPKWHKDYLAGKDLATGESAFKLDYRELPDGADIKLIWELSRWYQLVRLAMGAYVLGDARAATKCVEWLEDWVKHNPPYRGWNWTSALEVGMRLVQFTWIDALLGNLRFAIYDLRNSGRTGEPLANRQSEIVNHDSVSFAERLDKLRAAILPPHVWHAWRHKSFGSSANNHLIGELAGLILATVRWPALAQFGAPLDELQRRWEREVLTQFAEDGGNKEQALNYHLFSWEFCWQARMALAGEGRKIPPEVDARLQRAAQFFVEVQVPSDPWDYGDSDSAFVTPLFTDDRKVAAEWHEWFRQPGNEQALEYWMGAARREFGLIGLDGSEWRLVNTPSPQYWDSEQPTPTGRQRTLRIKGQWLSHEDSGMAVAVFGCWQVRLDWSWLGLGRMAAHGHLDALQINLWFRDSALVVDPGTGAYYANKELRRWLASRDAHNSPCLVGVREWPERLGPFLWQCQHYPPRGIELDTGGYRANLFLHDNDPNGSAVFYREVEAVNGGFLVKDYEGSRKHAFSVRWQFAPESRIEDLGQRRFRITRHNVSMDVQVSTDWAEVWCVTEQSQVAKADPDAPLAGTVSPAFRKVVWAPYLKLTARPQGDKPCLFTTSFLQESRE